MIILGELHCATHNNKKALLCLPQDQLLRKEWITETSKLMDPGSGIPNQWIVFCGPWYSGKTNIVKRLDPDLYSEGINLFSATDPSETETKADVKDRKAGVPKEDRSSVSLSKANLLFVDCNPLRKDATVDVAEFARRTALLVSINCLAHLAFISGIAKSNWEDCGAWRYNLLLFRDFLARIQSVSPPDSVGQFVIDNNKNMRTCLDPTKIQDLNEAYEEWKGLLSKNFYPFEYNGKPVFKPGDLVYAVWLDSFESALVRGTTCVSAIEKDVRALAKQFRNNFDIRLNEINQAFDERTHYQHMFRPLLIVEGGFLNKKYNCCFSRNTVPFDNSTDFVDQEDKITQAGRMQRDCCALRLGVTDQLIYNLFPPGNVVIQTLQSHEVTELKPLANSLAAKTKLNLTFCCGDVPTSRVANSSGLRETDQLVIDYVNENRL
jgi:hypothetical protein